MDPAEALRRRVARAADEGRYVNTINVNDRVEISLVWFPGAEKVGDSVVNTNIDDAPDGTKRWVNYTWSLPGRPSVTRPLLTGQITLMLPPGKTGTLTCFGTSWKVTRAAAGVTMSPANTLVGVQQRLDRLGYHLRNPGQKATGVDGIVGRITEEAVLRFQSDYRPAVAAPIGANSVLKVRGEWTENTDAAYTGNLQAYNANSPVAPNPSSADSQALQASLVARVGA
ncbi:MAG TPA: peptidoglycan-binding domain-containing protein [Polyangiaceae bacterium]|nr:peptidoglycan-binding domain-containing protein [Polyangiaceae bacterium]